MLQQQELQNYRLLKASFCELRTELPTKNLICRMPLSSTLLHIALVAPLIPCCARPANAGGLANSLLTSIICWWSSQLQPFACAVISNSLFRLLTTVSESPYIFSIVTISKCLSPADASDYVGPIPSIFCGQQATMVDTKAPAAFALLP